MPALLSILWLPVLLAPPACVADCETYCEDCVRECLESCEERCRGPDCARRCERSCSRRCHGCSGFCRRRLACGPAAVRASARVSTMRP
ncbi:MAG: hypothetical protein AAGF11_24735 [Myxococcota bacterium]